MVVEGDVDEDVGKGKGDWIGLDWVEGEKRQ